MVAKNALTLPSCGKGQTFLAFLNTAFNDQIILFISNLTFPYFWFTQPLKCCLILSAKTEGKEDLPACNLRDPDATPTLLYSTYYNRCLSVNGWILNEPPVWSVGPSAAAGSRLQCHCTLELCAWLCWAGGDKVSGPPTRSLAQQL